MAASENFSACLLLPLAGDNQSICLSTITALNHVASGIDCSLASSWFGISEVLALAIVVMFSEFAYAGMTADLCNKAKSGSNPSLLSWIDVCGIYLNEN